MKRGHQRNKERNKHTSRLLDQLGPEGRVGENHLKGLINQTYKFGEHDQSQIYQICKKSFDERAPN